jgi:lysophospholipase L1-like esterase
MTIFSTLRVCSAPRIIQGLLVAWTAFAVACGDPDQDASEDTGVSQTPATTPDGGVSPPPADAGASDAAVAIAANDAGARDTGVVGPIDAGRTSGNDGAVNTADAGADAAVSDAATNDGGGASSDSPCPSDGTPCKILPLGDSITYGIGSSDSSSYRVELFRKAQAAKQHITFVGSLQSGPTMVDGVTFPRNNEGHSGWTISQVAGLVPSPALQSKPNIVLLMAGTNDLYVSPGPADAPKRLGMLLDKLTDADPKMFIVVAQITPAPSYAAAVKTFNAAIPAVVKERAMAGKHITLVDMENGFPSGASADGIHPTAEGYKWMSGVWYDAIKQWLH